MMDEQSLRDIWHNDPEIKVNISTSLRKSIMLGNNLRLSFQGKSYEIKFKSIGGGVWQAFIQKSYCPPHEKI